MDSRSKQGRRVSESQPAYIDYPRANDGAPNVVMIVLDDVGFGQLGCFGGEIETPRIDEIAREGLKYNQFHVTSLCSPTRACLLSGRNHHAVGMGMTAEIALGFPGYTARIPRSAALLPRVLRDNGYNTMAVGKWHLTPNGEFSASGPFERWPLGQGFERFYGFLGASTDQWYSDLVCDNKFVDPPNDSGREYHLTEDLTDQAVRMIQDQQQATPEKPFFCYFAPGAAHSPHQVPASWITRYRGKFDDGWEQSRRRIFDRQVAEGMVPSDTILTERPAWVPAWSSLSVDERRLYARYMEVFAGFLSHADAHIGRLLDTLRDMDVLDNTLVILVSDNGASAEGGPTGSLHSHRVYMGGAEPTAEALAHVGGIGGVDSDNHYPWGWAWAGNTPLQLWKRYSWLGGVRTPLIVRYPNAVADTDTGGVRHQFCHAVDIFSTVLDAAGIHAPTVVDGVTQQQVVGESLVSTMRDAQAPAPRCTQYFEVHGSRSIYHNGWKATTNYVSPLFGERQQIPGSHDLDDDRWALFHLDEDFAETRDVASLFPEKVAALRDLWWMEAGRNNVLPMFEGAASMGAVHPGEFPAPTRGSYRPGGGTIERVPRLADGFVLEAYFDVRDLKHTDGVLCSQGDHFGGWALYVLNAQPRVAFSLFGESLIVASEQRLTAGAHRLTVRYHATSRQVSLALDRAQSVAAALTALPDYGELALFGGGLRIACGGQRSVTTEYAGPFPFSGSVSRVEIVSLDGATAENADGPANVRSRLSAD